MLWVDEFKPTCLDEWIGDPSIKSQVKNYFINPIVKCLILEGSAGNGKTSLIYAVANDLGFDVLEINASDKRGKNDMKELALAYYGAKPRIILIDEGDGIRAWNELADLIKYAGCPVVLTANHIDKINKKVVNQSLVITISYPPVSYVIQKLGYIVYRKGLNTIADTDIQRIAEKCTNIRSAIYTLQQFSMGKMKKIEPIDVEFEFDIKMNKLFDGKDVHLTKSDYNNIPKWAIKHRIPVLQLAVLSIMRAHGKKIAGFQDLIRRYCDNMRSD